MTAAGHLFVVQGDLRRLHCDAWGMPCDLSARPMPHWWSPGLPAGAEWPDLDQAWRGLCWDWTGLRVLRFRAWPAGVPEPWLLNSGSSGSTPISWYVAGAVQLVTRTGEALRAAAGGRGPVTQRALPLVALPLVGTGFGGAAHKAGAVLQELLPALEEAARAAQVDVALVVRDDPAHAAAQGVRRARPPEAWDGLSGALAAEAERLAGLAAQGRLVLFLGAGVSKGAGVPLWGELLDALAARYGAGEAERAALRQLDVTDQAQLLEERARRAAGAGGGDRPLAHDIARAVWRERYGLGHALLASLPARDVVTTNYDCLFEEASRAVGLPPSVLPHAPRPDAERWLLKLHGCASEPDEIVVTRADYLRYEARRAALAGIVQALLLTRHMLFVGFSLEDPNFHRIADTVRRARRSDGGQAGAGAGGVPSAGGASAGGFGTTLTLFADPLREELWRADVGFVSMQPAAFRAADLPDAARRLEVFLDRVAARASSATAHLLDERYEGALDEDERQLRDAVARFRTGLGGLPAALRGSPALVRIEELLRDLGAT